jgi:hypothetical protein
LELASMVEPDPEQVCPSVGRMQRAALPVPQHIYPSDAGQGQGLLSRGTGDVQPPRLAPNIRSAVNLSE